ncbi:hypothetical protein EON66_01190 [archaeon]|nr:MAG: hypothetical protein EON66_01190 [archaeon]
MQESSTTQVNASISASIPTVHWSDVGGLAHAKDEIMSLVRPGRCAQQLLWRFALTCTFL